MKYGYFLLAVALTGCTADKEDARDECVRSDSGGDPVQTMDALKALSECETVEGELYFKFKEDVSGEPAPSTSNIKEIVDYEGYGGLLIQSDDWPWDDDSFFGNLETVSASEGISLDIGNQGVSPLAFESLSFTTSLEVSWWEDSELGCWSHVQALLAQLGISAADIQENSEDCMLTGTFNGVELQSFYVGTGSYFDSWNEEEVFCSELYSWPEC